MVARRTLRNLALVPLLFGIALSAGVEFASGYRCKVVEFNPDTYKGQTGKITLPYNCQYMLDLIRMSDSKTAEEVRIEIRGKGKSTKAPVGRYMVAIMSLTVEDKSKTKWDLNTYATSRQNAKIIEIKPGSDVKLASGEPLVVSAKAVQNGSNINISAEISSNTGYKCRIDPIGRQTPKPAFKIYKAGKVLMSGAFEFGWGGSCRYSGRIPLNVKGTVTIKPIVESGPFKVTVKDTKWTRK